MPTHRKSITYPPIYLLSIHINSTPVHSVNIITISRVCFILIRIPCVSNLSSNTPLRRLRDTSPDRFPRCLLLAFIRIHIRIHADSHTRAYTHTHADTL